MDEEYWQQLKDDATHATFDPEWDQIRQDVLTEPVHRWTVSFNQVGWMLNTGGAVIVLKDKQALQAVNAIKRSSDVSNLYYGLSNI